jgi:putative ABC transport system permease protein
MTVVGVLHAGKYDRLDEPLHPLVYVPLAQWFAPAVALHVRTAGEPLALTESVRRALLAEHVDLPALQPRTLAEHISAATFTQRTGAAVLGAFAILALLLSVVGLYGALAFGVALRARELSIRLALGASSADVVRVVGVGALSIAGSGLIAGAALSIVGGRLLQSQIASVRPPDFAIYIVAALVLLAAAASAAWIPARRAVRLDPAVALRGE